MADAAAHRDDDERADMPIATARPRRPLLARSVAAAGVAAVVLGAGVGTSYALTAHAAGGASSPSGAVQELLTAADHSDVLGALSVLDPGERSALEPNLVTLVHQLTRLQVLSPAASLRSMHGVTLHFSGVRTKTTPLTPNLASVALTAGTVTEGSRLAQLPLGRFVRQLAGARLHGASESTNSAATGREGIATVRVGGRWYVSLGYTIAVDSLRSAGRTGAPPPGGIAPVGHASAAGAVRGLLTQASRFDLRRVIADLAPGELGAVQAYAPLFLPRARRALASAAKRVTIQLGTVVVRTRPVPGGVLAQVHLPDLTVHIRPSTTIAFRHGCLVETVAGTSLRNCRGGATSASAALAALPSAVRQALAPLLSIGTRLGHEHLETGILAVDEGGRWYVSPTGTLLHDLDTVLGGFRPSDLTAFARVLTELGRSAGTTTVAAPATHRSASA